MGAARRRRTEIEVRRTSGTPVRARPASDGRPGPGAHPVAREALPPPSMAAPADEWRRYQGHAAGWPVPVPSLGEAVDISLHGLKGLVQSPPVGIVHAGRASQLPICPETSDGVSCVAQVRRVNGRELSLETQGELPASLLSSDSLRLEHVPRFRSRALTRLGPPSPRGITVPRLRGSPPPRIGRQPTVQAHRVGVR